MRLGLLVTFVLAASSAAFGASVPDFSGLTYEQRLGNQIPLQQRFRDEAGRDLALAELVAPGKPLILALVYYHCPNLCGVVRSDLFDALKRSGMTAGRDYSLVALSIDPSESSTDATTAKRDDMQRFPAPGAADHWHFLTGNAGAIRAVADSVGFHERYDPEIKQFVHPVGIVFATPTGLVSSYLLGVGYQPGDVGLGVTRAQSGSVAAAALPVLLLCFHYDPTTGRYTLAIMKLLRLAAAITAVVVAGTLFLAFRRDGGRT
jgi:protein SCO1